MYQCLAVGATALSMLATKSFERASNFRPGVVSHTTDLMRLRRSIAIWPKELRRSWDPILTTNPSTLKKENVLKLDSHSFISFFSKKSASKNIIDASIVVSPSRVARFFSTQ
jgi:hypothetical protein